MTPEAELRYAPAPWVRIEKLTIMGLASTSPKLDIRAFLWPLLSAVQQSAYIVMTPLATGLMMGVNAPPFVWRNSAPARSAG